MDSVTISTVTPVYHGADYLHDLITALDAERTAWVQNDIPVRLLESIFVDDGSSDGSAEMLAKLAARYPWIQVVSLSRNFGQHPATIAGVLHTAGDWVVTLDEDLQHHPRHILKLLCTALRDGSDVVYAQSDRPVHHSRFRNWSSRTLKKILAQITGNPHLRLFNSFRMVRGGIARAASAVSVHDTYFDMLLAWFTNRVGTVTMTMHDGRHQGTGQSGYDVWRLLSHARRLIMSARINYLRVGAAIGLAGISISVILGVYTLGLYFISPQAINSPGWTSLFLSILFFGGLSALLSGILFEYFSTLLYQTQGKPTFFVVDRSGDESLRDRLPDIETFADERQVS